MGLFSFFKRPAAKAPASGDAAQAVDAARTTARRRLIGAVLLLGIGVIAFPLLFETQPRPLPVDISIEIPKKEGAAPLAIPAARPAAPAPAPTASAAAAAPAAVLAPPVITESKADAGKEVPAPAEAAAKAVAKPEPLPKVASKAAPPNKPVPAAAPTAETKPAGETPGRFVVQVGAFADTAGAREARAKVEKLGLKTYTQAVDTDKGKRTRVRLGPFASRDDAEKAAAKVKAAGLPAAVLTL